MEALSELALEAKHYQLNHFFVRQSAHFLKEA
jgi:hypothetical protein